MRRLGLHPGDQSNAGSPFKERGCGEEGPVHQRGVFWARMADEQTVYMGFHQGASTQKACSGCFRFAGVLCEDHYQSHLCPQMPRQLSEKEDPGGA